MYVKQLYIENSGPLKTLELSFSETNGFHPKPLIFVGTNGSGKTNLLSIIADALYEGAANGYPGVLTSSSEGRNWFRLSGGITRTVGMQGSCALIEFCDGQGNLFYTEKNGRMPPQGVKERIKGSLSGRVSWDEKDNTVKEFKLSEQKSREIYGAQVFLYFPASRRETPHWLNTDAPPNIDFETRIKIANKLDKPIFVETGLPQFVQWLNALMADSRFEVAASDDGKLTIPNPTSAALSLVTKQILAIANQILALITGHEDANFVWQGRRSSHKVGIQLTSNSAPLPPITLSSGQATLLSIFGTLLRYIDMSDQRNVPVIAEARGICIIDDIDSQMHVELQSRILPQLIKLFPKVQFIISTHSPLFILGMENEFGADQFELIELPTGIRIEAESFSEFKSALKTVAETKAFRTEVIEQAKSAKPVKILVEGETDEPYLKKALNLLAASELVENVDVEWVGSIEKKGSTINTGKDGLNRVFTTLRSNPDLIERRFILLYDNDIPKGDLSTLGVRCLNVPTNENNSVVKKGIENLLPEAVFEEKWFTTKETDKGNGEIVVVKSLDKAKLCQHLCDEGDLTKFAGFQPLIELLQGVVDEMQS